MTGQLMTIDEVAEATRVPAATLRYYRHLGTKGPQSFKIGRRVLYRTEDVEVWLAEQYARSSPGGTAT